MKTATAGLQAASGEVIDSHDQYEVFNDPRAVRCDLAVLDVSLTSLIIGSRTLHIRS